MSDIQLPNYLEFVGRTRENNGIKGYTIIDNIIPNEADTISISQVGTITAQLRKNKWYASQNIFVLRPYDKRYLSLAFLASINKALAGSFSDGYANYPTLEKLKAQIINLPQTKNKEIDFAFIDDFLRELERARLRELEAYLKATGLDNYELTEADKDALRNYKNLQWKEFPITKIFTIHNTHNILASDVKLNSGATPYLCASAENNGVNGYISYNTDLLEQGNCVFIGGKTFVVSYQKEDFYSNDSHNIALYLKDYAPTRANLLSLVTFVRKSLGHKYTWGDSVSKAKIKGDTITLPTLDGKQPDFNAMERLIAALQKIVIADVAKYTARNLEATQQVIESQEEQQEATITPLHIHDTYQPGRIPLYTLRAACGRFEDNELPVADGWVDASGHGFSPDKDRYFAVHAKGDSMLPLIHDGDICVFEWYTGGSRKGEIVLMQIRDFDPEYDGRYTIKRYDSEKIVTEDYWEHKSITLSPRNPAFEPIVVREDESVRTIGIFKCVL